MRSLFLAPHSDDETLFGAFVIQRYHPHVAILFPSSGDYGNTIERANESAAACLLLGADQPQQFYTGSGDELVANLQHLLKVHRPDVVWAPSHVTSHPDHRAVHNAAVVVFGAAVRRYDTYEMHEEWPVKVRLQPRLTPTAIEIERKLLALAKYQTQLRHPRAYRFFMQDLHEYAELP